MAKKLYLLVVFWIIMLSLLCFGARAMDWTTANQITVAWLPVTTLADGSEIPPGDQILYEVFSVPEAGNKTTDRIFIGETNATEYVVTFIEEGRYFIGVRSARAINAEKISVSTFMWSDDPAACKDGVTFGVIYFIAPGSVNGLEIKNNGG